MTLPGVETARARMLAGVAPLEPEIIGLDRALGRVLAADILAARDQPPFRASAMDGWAVRAADGAGVRRVVGESAAGRGYAGAFGAGDTVRIFTGAAVPAGADAIVIQEDARGEGTSVVLPRVESGRHVRPAAQDFAAGERLLAAGERLDPWRLALAAASGAARLAVRRRPRLAVLATGDELAPPGATPGPFQIFDSGSIALTALARALGAEMAAPRAVGDDRAAIARAVDETTADLRVVIGGASVGDHDLVKPALAELGLVIEVDGVAVRPGKPTWFGRLRDGAPVLGLPGNPASALVCAELFLAPILRAMAGLEPEPPMVAARADGPLGANGPREHWMRAGLRRDAEAILWASPFADQDSSLLAVFAASDALVRRRAAGPAVARGEMIDILPLARG